MDETHLVRKVLADRANAILKEEAMSVYLRRGRSAPRLSATSSREHIIDWLVKVDPNGVYTDEDMLRDFDADPMSLDDAWACVANLIEGEG